MSKLNEMRIIYLISLLSVCFVNYSQSLEGRFFYRIDTSSVGSGEDQRTFIHVACLYFSDSVVYHANISNEENDHYYYYNEDQSEEKNLKQIIKDFSELDNLLTSRYSSVDVGGVLHFFLDTEGEFKSKADVNFVDETRLYFVYTELERFNLVVDYTEFPNKYVREYMVDVD